MKNDNYKKRWIYDLNKKQACKIVTVVVTVFEVMFFIIVVSCIVTNWRPYEQSWTQRGIDMTTATIIIIVTLFCSMTALGFVISMLLWEILWANPGKQFYLFKKKHDETIVLQVREKFGLSPDFKEISSKCRIERLLPVHCYAKETECGILISIRDDTGEELQSQLITSYYAFDLCYEPKV